MSKVLSLIVPALALAFATFQAPEAQAAPRVVIHLGVPAKAPPARVWVPGHWEIHGGREIWIDGHYKIVPPGRSVWVPGRWELRAGKRLWVAGHWR